MLKPVLHLYTWSTPNGYKPLILLHELGADFEFHPVPLNGAQKSPEYLRINPNGKIPALRVGEGEAAFDIFESGAILTYLAETHGRFLPKDPGARAQVLSWVFFQNSGVGPMLSQLGFFRRADEKNPMAIAHYSKEVDRLLKVLETQLQRNQYVAGSEYTIADLTTYTWVRRLDKLGIAPGDYPALKAWGERIGEREAVQQAYETAFPKP